MDMAGQYKPESAWKRSQAYLWLIVLGGLLVAVGVTAGVIELEQVEAFINEWAGAVIVLGGASTVIAAAVARSNVEPPTVAKRVRDSIDD